MAARHRSAGLAFYDHAQSECKRDQAGHARWRGSRHRDCSATLISTTDPTASRQLRELDYALGQLPEEQRQVILLVGLEGTSYEDAAAILDVPVGTIRWRLSRGRNALRKLMDIEAKPAARRSFQSFTPKAPPMPLSAVAA